ncbi:MAG: hypothetical protein IJF02_01585 [Oscillospiraceae bacterium]|nr:hypothetical protein [Oscillospiraceae bacterium]
MNEKQIENVYYTLIGTMQEQFRVPGAENLFAQGSECMNRYCQMLAAYERLCDRLGVIDEDEDVEIIIDSLMGIERKFSMKMFEYGRKFALHNK